ncbi:major facilitator superfamily domain-containing protein [Dipodascopsis tothii]|uniref:major facilitator superfamily domain-containing protein n=1 Tax=Dipodascopsis tothii TaxID=44089 RepID=UPI0034CF571B
MTSIKSLEVEKAGVENLENAPVPVGAYDGMFDGVTLPAKGTPEREALEKRLKLKIDLAILPMTIAMYILNYLDRNNIAAAKLSTLMEDLHLSDTQYSTCVSILFIGYILMQVPSNLILEKIGKPSIYLPSAMAIWGILSACTAAVQGFGGLLAVRFLIGFAEAVFYPGVVFYLSCWYTRKEISSRSAIFVCGSWLSGAFSGLIAYGVTENLDGVRGLAAWRWLFLIEGVVTVGVALAAIPILPQLPATTRWLSKEERLLAVVRMIEDVGQRDDDTSGQEGDDAEKAKAKSAFGGFMLAVKDVKVVTIFLMMFSFAVTAGINTVFPTIVGSLGFSRPKTLLLTAPPWLLVALTSVLNSVHADRTGERYLHMLWGPMLSLIGFIIGISSTKTAPRYVAMILLLQVYNSWSLGFTWLVNTTARPPIKRAAAVACVNIGGNIPNTFVTYLFSAASATPHFYVGFGVCMAFAFSGMAFATLLRLQLARANKKLTRGETIDGMDGTTGYRFLL